MDDHKKVIAHIREIDKTEQTLKEHLVRVSQIAASNAGKINLAIHGELIGLLHDLGKYSEEFQNYLKSATGILNPDEDDYVHANGLKGKIDHSSAGAQYLWKNASSKVKKESVVAQILALCIASHHSGLIDCVGADHDTYGINLFIRRMEKSDKKTHLSEVISKVDLTIKERLDQILCSSALIEELLQKINQIFQANRKSEIVQLFHLGMLVRFLFSCLIDADRLDTADFEKPYAAKERQYGSYVHWDNLIKKLESKLAEFPVQWKIDEVRHDISQHCLSAATRPKGIYSLTVPTGGGKTLASLRFAFHHAKKYGMDRIVYVIPFTSIIDQNAQVIRSILEDDTVERGRIVLEHHSNLTPEEQGWKEKLLTENWDAPVVYTTSVQLLEALFGYGTRGARRMHQLANAVIVFDEIQTLPIKFVHLFNNAMNFLVEQCGSTVVLCTATQPLLHKVNEQKGAMKLLSENEIMPDVGRLFDELSRVDILNRLQDGGWSVEGVATLALNEVDASGSCLVIVNTKESALKLYLECKKRAEVPLFHLSTHMCPRHRKITLYLIRRRLKYQQPVLTISTQLIEAGVDVDFGSVIRYLAGLDSIAQAAGRCNRNGRRSKGNVYVVNSADECLGSSLREIAIGQEITERIFREFEERDLLSPKAMERYFHYYFFERQKEMCYPVKDFGHTDTLLEMLSKNELAVGEYKRTNSGNWPDIFLRHAFMTAGKAFEVIDAPTQGVIVPFGRKGRRLIAELCAAYEVEKQFRLLKIAQQYTVNLFPNVFKRLKEQNAIYPIQKGVEIYYLNERYYSSIFGLSTEAVNDMEVYIG